MAIINISRNENWYGLAKTKSSISNDVDIINADNIAAINLLNKYTVLSPFIKIQSKYTCNI